MKKKPFVLLLSILLSLFLFPLEAMAEEANDALIPVVGAAVVATVEANDTLATEANDAEVITTEESANTEATPLVVGDEDPAAIEEDTEQTDSNASATHINPAEYVINVDTAEFTIKYSEDEIYLSGKNITLENGTYNYELFANSLGKMTFNNDLDILYQEVNGKYSLHYAMVDSDDHTMIADGKFDNILKASPLLRRQRDRISDDSYAYQLALWTKEGFSFINSLGYLYDGNRYDYSVNYNYDLATNQHTLVIDGLPERLSVLRQGLLYS